MIQFALDLGNKQVKIKSEKGNYTLPSYFSPFKDMGVGIGFVENEKDYDKYESKTMPDQEFAWGFGINKHTNPTILDSFTFDNRYQTMNFKLISEFALGKLASDFEESQTGILAVNVVTGVPTNDHNKENVKSIIKNLKGLHEVYINDESYKIDVQNVAVLPQPLGTFYSELLKDDGSFKNEHLLNENITVVDVGGGTVLIDTIKQTNIDETETTQLDEGVYTMLDSIVIDSNKNSIKGLDPYKVEQIIKNKTDKGYIYQVNKRGESFNITDTIEKNINNFSFSLASYIQATVKDMQTKDRIIFTGGGSNFLNFSFLEQFKYVEVTENPERANCEGYYRYGLATQKSGSEQQ